MKIRAMLAGASLCMFGAMAAQAQTTEPLKIGFLAEMAGMYGAPGQDQYDAFMLAVEERGGKLGGVPVQIIKEDTQFKPDVASQIVDRLLDREKVELFTGITYTHIALAVYKKISDKGAFLVASNTGPALIAGEGCVPNFFTTTWQNDQLSEVVGRYAKEKGYKKVFALAPNYQAGKDFVAGFKKAYSKPLLNEVYTPVAQQDFSAELSMIQAEGPDAVYVFYPGALGVNFVKQYAQAGLKNIPLLNTATTEGINLPAQGESATGAVNGSFWGPDFDNETSKHFVAAFEAKYNRIPSQYAAQGYDSALLIDSALKKVNGDISNKDAFRAALKEADFKSLRGDFKFGNNHFPIQDFHVFEAYKDNKGRMNVRRIATPMVQAQDGFAHLCPMK
ncbi:ABC transporter substrate-binding protein [Pusillimonas sp. T2]|uniref:ABC transporter substrate-binding protein n=1 Tax=Pusillimonas sp. T2 TaxID=1548123 RepID=UPI000B8AAAF1|nr:ABC transporter substrate-binding protein [Pusillimonas sp. T2]OXR48066.1 ABC transporter substrate-binding protein [Pusillimonas sp. T2]